MANNRPIGFFDSGVGGLSVLLEVKKNLPSESFVFLADQGHNPYGEKTKKQLEALSERITKFLLKHDIKILVVACNTATCYAIDHLRYKFNIPIIGVVPAVKTASTLTKNGKIAVMSTPATAKSRYLASLVSQFAPRFEVLKLGCVHLEDAIEYLNLGEITNLINVYAGRVRKFGADTVVLGCTHFPFFKTEIKNKLGERVRIIDSGEAIGKRVFAILSENNAFSLRKQQDIYYTTAVPQIFSKVASTLLQYKVDGRKAYLAAR